MLIDGKGCWFSQRTGFDGAGGRAALFLDRDNLLLADPGFLHRPADVTLMDGAGALVAWANRHAIPTVIVTNQSGVARGIFGWDDFCAVNARMDELLARQGAHIDAVLACGWHADAVDPVLRSEHYWRKPRPGMLHAAARRLDIHLSRSWLIGDRASDVLAAELGGLAGGIRVAAVGPETPADGWQDSFVALDRHRLTDVLPLLPALFGQAANDRPKDHAHG
jgi:D-glycero-D-manno-heptose 1,7-bisphosphate phosphatase